jgi:hypothetical protein
MYPKKEKLNIVKKAVPEVCYLRRFYPVSKIQHRKHLATSVSPFV